MDSIQLGDIFKLIDSSKIHKVPDESLIKGWVQGCDGILYIIETANSTDYSIKTYWTPSVQDSLKEAKIVQDFVDSIKEISGAGIIWNQFVKEVPFECSSEGIIVWCKVLSKGERRKYRKERETYR